MKKGIPRKGCHKRWRGLSQSDMGHLFASALPSKSPWVVRASTSPQKEQRLPSVSDFLYISTTHKGE